MIIVKRIVGQFGDKAKYLESSLDPSNQNGMVHNNFLFQQRPRPWIVTIKILALPRFSRPSTDPGLGFTFGQRPFLHDIFME